jgi:hypothetical protein
MARLDAVVLAPCFQTIRYFQKVENKELYVQKCAHKFASNGVKSPQGASLFSVMVLPTNSTNQGQKQLVLPSGRL